MVIGAEMGWSPDTQLDWDFECAASSLLYDCDEVNMIDLVRTMGQSERTCDWMEFMYWYSANTCEGRVTELKCDTEKAIANIARLDKVMETINGLGVEDDRYTDLIIACKAIKTMNRVHLNILGVDGYTDRADIAAEVDEWLPQFCERWMAENKESQLRYVVEFMNSLSTVVYNTNSPKEGAVEIDREV